MIDKVKIKITGKNPSTFIKKLMIQNIDIYELEQNEDSFNEDINNINFEKSPENKSNNEIKEDENYSDDIKESNSITNDLKLSNNDNIAHQIFKIPETEQIQQPQEKTQIKQIFTADELEEQLATPFDNEIKINDYPERMQLLYSKDELPNLMDNLEAEVNLIFDKMKFNNNDENEENLRKKIFLVLECNKKDFFLQFLYKYTLHNYHCL